MNRVTFAVLEILAAAVFLVPIFWLRYRDLRKCVTYCVFSFYLVAVYSLVGLPTVLYSRFETKLNLVPFLGMVADWKNCILNVLLFVPLGILLPIVWEKYRAKRNTLLFGLGMSLTIELLQMFTFRATDINDIITNVLGTYIGFFLAKVLMEQVPAVKGVLGEKSAKELYMVCAVVFAVMFFPQPFLSAGLWELFAH